MSRSKLEGAGYKARRYRKRSITTSNSEVKETMKVSITAKRAVILFMAMALAVVMVACERTVEKPGAPTIANTIVGMVFDHGAGPESITLTGYFTTADGATYSAASSKPSVATATVSGAVLTVTPKAAGSTNVTVTATDENGKVSQTFSVTVKGPEVVVNNPPTVRTIPDRTLKVGTTETLDLSRYAEDPDGDRLMYAAESSNEAVAEVSVANGALMISAVAEGAATITVTVDDGTNSPVAREFDVTITTDTPPPNNPPTIGTIIDRTLEVGDTRDISLAIYANDPDGDTLTYDATSDDPAVATVSVANDVLTITAVAAGTATITVTVDDGTNSPVAREFNVTVNPDTPENEQPEQELIDDIDDMRRAGTRELDLSDYYDDPDGDPLTYEATSSNEDAVTVSVSGSMLTITGVGVGTARIMVTATDNITEARRQTFSVTVGSQPPMATTTLPTNIPLGMAGSTQDIDLSLYFSDPEGDALTYTAMSDNTDVATVTGPGNGSVITITAVAAKSPTEVGTATITVTAQDADNAAVSLDLFVTVDPTGVDNTAPAVRGIDDMVLETGEQSTLDLGMHFIDAPGDELTYEATSIMMMYVTVAVDDSTLTITAVDEGTSRITVKATDSYGAAATTFFMVTVEPPNVAPVVSTEIPDQSLEMDFDDKMKTLDLSMYFSDLDGPEALSYEATSSNTMYATEAVDGSTLTIEAVAAGTATITVTASDGAASVQDTFTVTVSNPAPPTATSELPDQDFAYDDMEARMFTLSDYFLKATMYDVSVSGDASVVTATEADGVLTLTPGSAGSAMVKVTPSNSGGIGSSQTIDVTVADEPAELMLPPRPVGTIAAQEVAIGATGTVNVAGNFVEPEGETLTYAATSSNEAAATATVSDAGVVSITGVAAGSATITITVTDTDGLTAMQTIAVTVPAIENTSPRYVGSLLAEKGLLRAQAYSIPGAEIESSFEDAEDEDLEFSLSVNEDGASIVRAILEDDNTVTIVARALGSATVTITATDTGGKMASHAITVTVVASLKPAPAGMIPDQPLTVGGPAMDVDVFTYFSAPAPGVGGDLEYVVGSNKPDVATAVAVGSVVTITPVAEGMATITVTATNSNGSATQTISVTVAATPPMAVGMIPDQTLTSGTRTIDLGDYFAPAVAGDTLEYTVSGGNSAVSARVIGAILLIEALAEGSATLTVTATDGDGEIATQPISVIVQAADQNMAPRMRTGMMLPDLKIQLVEDADPTDDDTDTNTDDTDDDSGAEAADNHLIDDLNKYFEDPDGALLFYTVTKTEDPDDDDDTPVIDLHSVVATADAAASGDAPDGTDDDDTVVVIEPRNPGTATVLITVTDIHGATTTEDFVVEVFSSDTNTGPSLAGTPATLTAGLVDAAGTADNVRMLKIDEERTVIEDEDFDQHFTDPNFTSGDVLKISVKYFAHDVDAEAAANPNTSELDADKVGVEADLSDSTWGGDPNDEFTLKLTGLRGTDNTSTTATERGHIVALIATDTFGESVARVFRVMVNNPPKAEGAQASADPPTDPLTLSDEDDYEELTWDGLVDADGNERTVTLVGTGTGYFHDPDADEALTCRYVTSPTSDEDAPADIALDTYALTIQPDAPKGEMTVTVTCEDTFDQEASDTLRIGVDGKTFSRS